MTSLNLDRLIKTTIPQPKKYIIKLTLRILIATNNIDHTISIYVNNDHQSLGYPYMCNLR